MRGLGEQSTAILIKLLLSLHNCLLKRHVARKLKIVLTDPLRGVCSYPVELCYSIPGPFTV